MAMTCNSPDPAEVPQGVVDRPAPAVLREQHQRWAERLAALDDRLARAPRLQSLAAEIFHYARAVLAENADLARQVGALEVQVRTVLADRIALAAQVATLEEQIATLQQERAGGQALVDHLIGELDYARRRPTRAEHRPIPLRAPLAESRGNAATSDAEERAVALTRRAASVGTQERPTLLRFQSPAVSDEETLLVGASAELPAESVPGAQASRLLGFAASDERLAVRLASSSYALIAHPFARFSDLGQFQAAIQGLAGVHNVRVRRFAQGTLEMRVDYDGHLPLTDALRGLPLAVDEVVQEETFRLRVRLTAGNVG